MKVYEIFHSIQGEGIYIGTKTIFVRLAGCNLRCLFCDSQYAFEEGKEMTDKEIISEIQKFPQYPWIDITGGEPLMQRLEKLVLNLRICLPVQQIMIETNSTIEPSNTLWQNVHFWSVSPKLSNSGMLKHLNKGVIYKFAQHSNCQFKFVIDDPVTDVKEVFDLFEELHIYHLPNLIFQPNGFKDQLDIMRIIQAYTQKEYAHKDFRILPQLHVLMYGHRRGV